jgi:hypothetical protein
MYPCLEDKDTTTEAFKSLSISVLGEIKNLYL